MVAWRFIDSSANPKRDHTGVANAGAVFLEKLAQAYPSGIEFHGRADSIRLEPWISR
jgi:hypothetical protein